jgi:hypothetical protein
MWRSALLIAGFVGALAACGSSGGNSDTSQASQITCRVGQVERVAVRPIHAGSQAVLLHAVEEQIGTDVSLRIGTPPKGFTRGHSWMTLPPSAASSAISITDSWTALLAAEIYRDQAPMNHLPALAGTTTGLDSSVLADGPRPHAAYRTLSAASLACLVRRNALALRMRVLSVRFLHPEGIPVPVINAEVPASLARRSGGQTGLAIGLLRYQHQPYSPYLGYLVQIEDSQGHWVQAAGAVPDSGGGTGGFALRYAHAQECGGLVMCTTHG